MLEVYIRKRTFIHDKIIIIKLLRQKGKDKTDIAKKGDDLVLTLWRVFLINNIYVKKTTYFHTNNDDIRIIKTNKTVHNTNMADVWNDGLLT